jgi:hypothetical protein
MRFLSLLLTALALLAPTDSYAQDQGAKKDEAKQEEAPKNSTRKIRAQPSATAARAGEHVQWMTDIDAAIAKSKETGKPVFWYVPTISKSFMDRKIEIDRYMMAGPFSWPRMITRLNDHFIPVKLKTSRKLNERFGIERIKFVEPGFLVLDGEGKEVGRQDKITTYHPDWFDAVTAAFVDSVEPQRTNRPGFYDQKNMEYLLMNAIRSDGHRVAAIKAIDGWKGSEADSKPEALFALGAALFWNNNETEASRLWSLVAKEFPDSPWGHKAAAEAEGHGPIVHGLETWGPLPEGALNASGQGTRVTADVYTENQLWQSGVDWLVRMQRSDGGWTDSIYDFGGTDGLPNVFTAVSAIAVRGLLEASTRIDSEEIDIALEKGLAYISDESHTNPVDSDELVWAHLYRVQTLARWIELRPTDKERIKPVLDRVAALLVDMQLKSGSWHHEYPNPFVTADALVALEFAQRMGTEVGSMDALSKAGCSALIRCRTEEGAITYGAVREGRKARASIEGGVGRIPRVELALALWKSEDAGALNKAVALSFEHGHHLANAQKYDDHTNIFAYGGFFFWYDLQARTEALMHLEADAEKKAWIARQRAQIVSLAEIDGAFIDSHEIGRVYGTGMALWCLAMLGS